MGSYQANRREIEPEEQPKELSESEKKQMEKQRNDENNAGTVKTAIKAGQFTPWAGIFKAVDAADDLLGGAISRLGGKALTINNKFSPGGKMLQGLSNKLNESGINSVAQTAADMKGGGKGAAASKGAEAANKAKKGAEAADKAKKATDAADKAQKSKEAADKAKKASDNAQKTTQATAKKSDVDKAKKKKGEKKSSGGGFNLEGDFSLTNIIFVLGLIGLLPMFLLVLLIMFFFTSDYQNLSLTNQSTFATSSTGSRYCTSVEIEENAIYVGDTRMVGMKNAIGYTSSTYIASQNQGYDWLKNSALTELDALVSNNNNSVVIFGLGLYDLINIDNYITIYKEIIQKYPAANIYILSVNPVDETNSIINGTKVLNVDIDDFNKRLASEFPNNYIDTNTKIKTTYATIDGIDFDTYTYVSIKESILSDLVNNHKITCSDETTATINSNAINGGDADLLSVGNSLLSILGQEKIDEWNNAIRKDVLSTGVGSGSAVTIAAYGLIQGALNEGYVIPYFWGGGNDVISTGVNSSWGSSVTITKSGNLKQPVGSIQASGLDNTGLISWAIKNGGCSNFVPLTIDGFSNLGTAIDINKAVSGDLLISDTHIMLVMKQSDDLVQVAEAKDTEFGVVFNEYYYNDLLDYKAISMSDYYYKNCNG